MSIEHWEIRHCWCFSVTAPTIYNYLIGENTNHRQCDGSTKNGSDYKTIILLFFLHTFSIVKKVCKKTRQKGASARKANAGPHFCRSPRSPNEGILDIGLWILNLYDHILKLLTIELYGR